MIGSRCTTLAGSILFVSLSIVSAPAQTQSDPGRWKADPEAVKSLGESVEIDGFRIPIPKGFQAQPGPALPDDIKQTVTMGFWMGPMRKDGGRRVFSVVVSSLPEKDQETLAKAGLEPGLRLSTDTFKTRYQNWKQDKLEVGTIHGLEFMRVHWSGTMRPSGVDQNGFICVARERDKLLTVTSFDNANAEDTGGSSTQAAVLSIQRVGAVPIAAKEEEKPLANDWQSEPSAVKNLGDTTSVNGYSIQVPKGYTAQKSPAVANAKLTSWAGLPRKDQTRPSLTLSVITPPAAEVAKNKDATLEQISERLIGAIKTRRKNWKQDPTEKGSINGIEFVRIHWSGLNTENYREMRGFLYVAKEGDSILQISSQDFVPTGDKALSIAEAAALTLQKK